MSKKTGKIVGAAAGLGAAAVLSYFIFKDSGEELPVLVRESSQDMTEAESTETVPETIYVHVCGAVETPGVYLLPGDARRSEALAMAGGFTEAADRSYVNLAVQLKDGEQLYFPTVEEAEALRKAEAERTAGLVNINTAGQEALETLPGIGPSLAKAIISYRDKNGNFSAIEEIMQVPGIKEGVFSKIKDKITV